MVELLKQQYAGRPVGKLLWFCACIVVSFIAITPQFLDEVSAWYASFWLFDYQSGFIKRGFIGQIVSVTCPVECANLGFIQNASYGILFVLAFILALFVFLVFNQYRLFGIGFLLAGFSLQQFAFDVGRHDQINYILLFISIFFALFLKNRAVMFVLLMSCTILMLLIHEASIFMQVPVLLSVLLLGLARGDFGLGSLKNLMFFVCTIVIFFFTILFLGNINETQKAELNEQALSRAGTFKSSELYLVTKALDINSRSIVDNVKMTMDVILKPKMISRLLMILGVSLPFLAVFIIAFRQIDSRQKTEVIALLLPVLCMLPLFVVAYDWFRWIAMMMFNYMLVLGLILHKRHMKLELGSGWYYSMLLFSVYSGPYGITIALPERRQILDYIKYLVN